MTEHSHGISIGVERTGQQVLLRFTAQGHLTHQDYLAITPVIESALAAVKQQQVKVLVDASQLQGWELRAAWDDFKLALKHGNQFEKIAIYGHQSWQPWAAKLANWFVQGEIAFFAQYQDAVDWLQ